MTNGTAMSAPGARRQRTGGSEAAAFCALFFTALALGPPLAHLLALPNKIGMPAETYFAAQTAYRGWSLTAVLLLLELAGMIAVAWFVRFDRKALVAALAAIGCVAVAQIVFWTFTFPANKATENWTAIPDDWQSLRAEWEYSHAAGAGFQLLALALLIVAVLRGLRE